MKNLTSSQRWVIVAFAASAMFAITTFLLEGNVQIVAYMLVGLAVAGYAIISSSERKENDAS